MAEIAGLQQSHFRGRYDDGSQTTATWKVAANTNWSQVLDVTFRIRFVVQNDGSVPDSFLTKLQYNLNAAGWVDITTSSTVIIAVNSANITDTEATTQQVGAASFVAGEETEDGVTASVTLNGLGDQTEHELVCQILSTGAVVGDTIQVRCLESDGTVFQLYSQTPTITVSGRRVFVVS
ncbi:MAG: hypothetical protein NUV80_05135 [Candidatus Berkelbacteria bacterium]|nr:hypothetical protein [Candidatus Berkelbacteria bacterium]